MTRSGVAVGLLLSAIASLATGAGEIELPLTMEQVWYRTEDRKGFIGAKSRGDLTISRHAVDYLSRKETISIPVDEIHGVFLGKMKGDVDTDWVLLLVGSREAPDLVGFRDGRALGYGRRTPEIYETLRDAFRAIGAAQYRTPEGFVTYDVSGRQFTIAVPENWGGRRLSAVHVEDGPDLGTTLLDELADLKADDEQEYAGRRGDGLLLERVEVDRAASCERLGRHGERGIVAHVEASLERRGARWTTQPRREPTRLARCEGVRLRGTILDAAGRERAIDYRGIADRGVAYVVSFESAEDAFPRRLERIETILNTLQISPSR